MLLNIILEGISLSTLMIALCAIGISNGAVDMVHLYHQDVQDQCVKMGLTTHETIQKRSKRTRIIALLCYIGMLLGFVYGINHARGFLQGFVQMFAILSIVNLVDRFLIDEYWVGKTKAWTIPGTESLKPYIDQKDKTVKWIMGTAGMACLSALIAGLMSLILK